MVLGFLEKSPPDNAGVTSSCLRKKVEGAVFPLVILIQGGEDGIDDVLDALDIREDHQGSNAATNLNEAALDGAGRTQRAPQGPGKVIEAR
jgi:hypothetical protein